MTERMKKLFAEMLIGMRRNLDRAEAVYLQLARFAVESMNRGDFTPERLSQPLPSTISS